MTAYNVDLYVDGRVFTVIVEAANPQAALDFAKGNHPGAAACDISWKA